MASRTMELYEILSDNLKQLVAKGASAEAIQNAAAALANVDEDRLREKSDQIVRERWETARQGALQEGDRLKEDPSLWPGKLGDHLERHFNSWSEIAKEACRIAGIDADSPMRCLVNAVAEAAAKTGDEDY